MKKKLAIYGGTFDPIHEAHLTVARKAAATFALDRVLIIPANRPPHKDNAHRTPWHHRYRMVELACDGNPLLEPSRLEEAARTSYSIDTIERVASQHPGDQIYFVIGADAFAEIHTWYRVAEVLNSVEFIVVSRPGHDYAIPAGARVCRLDGLDLPYSSTRIRAQIAEGVRPAGLPDPVWSYIRHHQLYGASSPSNHGQDS